MKQLTFSILILLTLFASCNTEKKAIPSETIDYPFEGRTAEFQKARFGALLCFGIYSGLAGEWEGTRYYGTCEWLMKRVPISPGDYRKAALDFNPAGFDAEELAGNLKNAGMKYVVFTSKFHDGFAMWDSKASDFDIVDASPYGRDLTADLASAVQKAGIKIGFYYSQYQDWYEPGGGNSLHALNVSPGEKYDQALMQGTTSRTNPGSGLFQEYLHGKVVPQLNELLSGYGDIFLIWFDTPGSMIAEDARMLADLVHEKQPECLVSARIGNNLGDYLGLSDSEVPVLPIEKAWETPMTHNENWGYSKLDHDFKPAGEIIRMLAEVAAKGGNLLLSAGPDGTGRMPETAVEILNRVGDWLEINGESIYGTAGSPIPKQPWGVSTIRPGKLYLHIFELPASGELFLPEKPDIKQVYTLEGLKLLDYREVSGGTAINVSPVRESENTVLVIEYSGEVKSGYNNTPFIITRDYEKVILEAPLAELHGGAETGKITYAQYWGAWKHREFAAMSRTDDRVSWEIDVREAGTYRVFLEYMCEEAHAGREGFVRINNRDYPFKVLRTTDKYERWTVTLPLKQSIGPVALESGLQKISIRPREDGEDYFINLNSLILEPVDMN